MRKRISGLLSPILMLVACAGTSTWLATPDFDRPFGGGGPDCGAAATKPPSYPQSVARHCGQSEATGEFFLGAFGTFDGAEPIIDFYTDHARAVSATAVLKAPGRLLITYQPDCDAPTREGQCSRLTQLIKIDDPLIGITTVNINGMETVGSSAAAVSRYEIDWRILENARRR